MAEFVFGTYRLEADVAATRAWYAAHGEIAGGCDCAYCRNFAAAIGGAPGEVLRFLRELGADPLRPREVMELGREPDGRRLYEVIYHIAGLFGDREGPRMELLPEVHCGFSAECDLLPEEFPRPCFQLDLDLRLPWVLPEPEEPRAGE